MGGLWPRAPCGRRRLWKSSRPASADVADAARYARARDPRLRGERHLQPVRHAQRRIRQGDQLPSPTPPHHRVPEVPQDDRRPVPAHLDLPSPAAVHRSGELRSDEARRDLAKAHRRQRRDHERTAPSHPGASRGAPNVELPAIEIRRGTRRTPGAPDRSSSDASGRWTCPAASLGAHGPATPTRLTPRSIRDPVSPSHSGNATCTGAALYFGPRVRDWVPGEDRSIRAQLAGRRREWSAPSCADSRPPAREGRNSARQR